MIFTQITSNHPPQIFFLSKDVKNSDERQKDFFKKGKHRGRNGNGEGNSANQFFERMQQLTWKKPKWKLKVLIESEQKILIIRTVRWGVLPFHSGIILIHTILMLEVDFCAHVQLAYPLVQEASAECAHMSIRLSHQMKLKDTRWEGK